MSTPRLRLRALCAAALCVVGVVVGVVVTGPDGRVVDLLAVVAVATLVIAWRLHGRVRDETVTD